MEDKKKLEEIDLEQVSGGCEVGNNRVVECENCKQQFNPDIVEKGPNKTNTLENGGYGYATFKCPFCNEFHRVKYIQVKQEDVHYKIIYFDNE